MRSESAVLLTRTPVMPPKLRQSIPARRSPAFALNSLIIPCFSLFNQSALSGAVSHAFFVPLACAEFADLQHISKARGGGWITSVVCSGEALIEPKFRLAAESSSPINGVSVNNWIGR